jgi:hypothetical protein
MPKPIPQHVKGLAKQHITEYLRCKASFDYFASKYVFLELPGKDVLLTAYGKQTELIDLIEKKKYVLVLKSRQIGISTIIQAYAAWLTIFFSNTVVGIISKDGKEATTFARTIRGIIEKLPDWMKPPKGLLGRGFAKRAEQSFILTNGSKVYAETVNPNRPENTLRGKAVTLLVIDEAAFVNHIDTAWTAIVPALSTNQMHARKAGIPFGTVVLSTPNKTVGIGQWYFSRYNKAISHEDIFQPFVIHWKMIPELANDPGWYKIQCQLFDNDPRKIAQELELKFLPTEGSFFGASTVETMQDSTIKPIRKLKLYNGEIWKFHDPTPNTYYIIGVDTAPEHGEDKSAITVWNYETLEQVWEYQGKCKVLDFVKVIKVAATEYPGMIVVETTGGYGNQVVEHLNQSEFSLTLYKEKRGLGKGPRGYTLVPGLSNNVKTRPLIIDALYSYITEFPQSVRSERLALELTGLVSKANGKVEADIGCHDDLALSSALCFYVRKYDPPLMIDTGEFSMITNELKNVVNFNIEEGDRTEMTNASIIKKVKSNIEHNKGGFVDIMRMYSNE